jgi:hypothetical protein
LAESIFSSHLITEAEGYMKYWYQLQNSQPSLSRMAQADCLASGWFYLLYRSSSIFSLFPATSVDAEQAFSTGHSRVN